MSAMTDASRMPSLGATGLQGLMMTNIAIQRIFCTPLGQTFPLELSYWKYCKRRRTWN